MIREIILTALCTAIELSALSLFIFFFMLVSP